MPEEQEGLPEDSGLRCNCEDEFISEPCPVHSALKNAKEQFGQSQIIITDEYLVSDKQGTWQGFLFLCPVCQQPAIMKNPSMGKFCCNCGQPVVVESAHITKYIRSKYKDGGK